jgi:TPR repeat protein
VHFILQISDFYIKDGSPHADASKAKYWYSKAHDKGYAPASYMLGRIYSKSRQYDLTFAAFSKGAEKGYAPAIYRLAKVYQVGEMARSKRHIFAKRDLAGLLPTGRFGLAQALRGAMLLLSLWSDVAFLVGKAIKGESTLDEHVLA